MKKYEEIIQRCITKDVRYWAGDNISHLIESGEKEQLIEEATEAFETVLDTLIIDRHTDRIKQIYTNCSMVCQTWYVTRRAV